ncbi:hypothetical protein JQX09_22490 [Sulfitobacter pseudonitzschiae]|uniref:DUF1653 domain-containing protein n=1 Tax=Pseudosulfitobacter pseudonitzschiae TaxID=1402135 RepID=A0A9Q2RUT4_9RHOB|nr:hypothetical protein [Pseudosulfitobacter pseudonitzschiae]MBM2294694.1 hypothetical protein [Pseudosulfitobacter pseudonitzschiae]MBM2299631.1 hypothetical protein [Pseudosulfitobacter pseudonitzschiae]MBM2304532.1 hypothetical protein [Pseudosulfitobacter pseudonitzschiae]MBM2314305.1 hypothetical protein [Pseudosulfitobacter pseudonitzschiae]MBM2319223.1 hypothetical protein [Pseudosulfitobacter pseudonitzschiae]
MTKEEIAAAMLAVEKIAPINSKWRHLKSNRDYAVCGYVMLEASATVGVAYAELGPESPIWARDAAEFLDGRFLSLANGT